MPNKKTHTKSRSTTFRHKPELMRKVDGAARAAGLSRNKFIELVLAKYVDEKTPAEIRDMALAHEEQEAMADAPNLFD